MRAKEISLFLIIMFLSIVGCKNNSLSIEEKMVKQCIDAHGGMDAWNNLITTEYRKDITLFYQDGEIEKDLSQIHKYIKNPSLSGTIEWADSLNRKITYANGNAYKTNGSIPEEVSLSALNTFNSAYYVLNMPWKLMDESTEITYLGLDTILENKIVHCLKVEYPTEGEADIWEYYLDKDEYFLVANKVHHGSTYSLITNDDYTSYRNLKFNSKRTSYMVDSLGEVLYLRAKYKYIFE